jgi:Rrf2 family protein
MAQLAADETGLPVKADFIARSQTIPSKFLLGILNELKRARLVRSHRGLEGGYELAMPAGEITIADVIRAIDGPLATVRDTPFKDLVYEGPAEGMLEIWMAVRASLRSVLEHVTLADLASGTLPPGIKTLAAEYGQDIRFSSTPQ